MTAVQIALVWLLTQKPWIVPIPGTTKLNHLNEDSERRKSNLADDLHEIESAFSKIAVQGARLSDEHMALIDR